MKYYGKAEQVAHQIIEAFEAGNVPAALAQVYIQRNDDKPCRRWSFQNQFLTALAGTRDARGFRQWQEVGRQVKKGAKAFHILAPIVKTFTDTDDDGNEEKRRRPIGFKSVAVFRIEDTEGDPLPGDEEAQRFLDALPFVDVARRWGLAVESFNGEGARFLGYYRHGQEIAVGVENLSTWAHELVHAADDKLGNLTKAAGQQVDNEIVAELGAAVLLEAAGMTDDADRGGAWRYIRRYAEETGRPAAQLCAALLDRTCQAVALILTGADEIAAEEPMTV